MFRADKPITGKKLRKGPFGGTQKCVMRLQVMVKSHNRTSKCFQESNESLDVLD